MFHVALWEPEIPPNTGNIARLCAATGSRLHLVGKLGFRLDDKDLKRAGLDYWPAVDVVRHLTYEGFEAAIIGQRVWCVDNPADVSYTRADFRDGDVLLFGSETKGVAPEIRAKYAGRQISIPMPTDKVRSLNLSTAVGIVVYEALRQTRDW